jgi:molybdenum cofactor biosynthesis enzyme MoaA
MEAQNLSIIVGNEACNAKCPYCVSSMTYGLDEKVSDEINWRNFDIATKFARNSGVNTIMLTGKGEPTLFPDQITGYLKHLENVNIPFIELQTNGLKLYEQEFDRYLKEWYGLGLTTIAISIAHYDKEKNRQIFTPHKNEYPDLENLVNKLHDLKYSIRLTCVMVDEYIDSPYEVKKLIDYASENKIEQLTIRPVRKPNISRNDCVSKWVDNHGLNEEKITKIKDYLDNNAVKVLDLMHGATVYDFNGQNICLTDALTIEPNNDKIRQLIFFPDGHLRYDWQYKGAIII